MNKNLKIVAASAGNSFFNRHLYFYNNNVENPKKKRGGVGMLRAQMIIEYWI